MRALAAILGLLCITGCASIKTQNEITVTKPIELDIKPIQVSIDVNVRLDRALDDFFGGLDAMSEQM